MIWVAAASPLANLAMMVGWAMVGKIALNLPTSGRWSSASAQAGICQRPADGFNLFPLPLDGGRIGRAAARAHNQFSRTEPIACSSDCVAAVGDSDKFMRPLVSLSIKFDIRSIGLS
jgi:Zn-dependent protease